MDGDRDVRTQGSLCLHAVAWVGRCSRAAKQLRGVGDAATRMLATAVIAFLAPTVLIGYNNKNNNGYYSSLLRQSAWACTCSVAGPANRSICSPSLRRLSEGAAAQRSRKKKQKVHRDSRGVCIERSPTEKGQERERVKEREVDLPPNRVRTLFVPSRPPGQVGSGSTYCIPADMTRRKAVKPDLTG